MTTETPDQFHRYVEALLRGDERVRQARRVRFWTYVQWFVFGFIASIALTRVILPLFLAP